MARLRVALRTQVADDELPAVETPDFTIDLAAKRVHKGDRDIRLSATEWQVVELLARKPGRLVTQRQLLEGVWGLRDTKSGVLRVFLATIRRKLEPDPAHPRYFVTEPGSGIRFVPEESRARTIRTERPPQATHGQSPDQSDQPRRDRGVA